MLYRTPTILILLLPLTACGIGSRLDHLGRAPSMSEIGEVVAPPYDPSVARPGSSPSQPEPARHTSLFRSGARALFTDQRASQIGDILTVRINIADRAEFDNTTTRSRSSSESAGLPKLFGLETVLPNAVSSSQLVDARSGSKSTGDGQTHRQERLDTIVAAIVTRVLPNGNLVIQGKQEVRVNYELRELVVSGIVRPEDITPGNTIEHSQIAEARIAYGGRGQLSDVQQPRWGQQVYDAIFPF